MSLEPEIEITLFEAAGRIEDPAARKVFIDWALRDAPEEAQRMNAALVADDAAQRWFERATDSLTNLAAEIAGAGSVELPALLLESAEADDLAQSVAPRYTILETIGGGGGGQVYLAEQLQPVRRKVAIKLLRSGLEAPVFLAAFQHERQILAAMNHPGIATIFDAGATLSGRPFLVMEFVEGVSITDYCDSRHLTLRQRLDLFLQVCSALQHAHQKGIIHRDIKPSNLLVTHAARIPPARARAGIKPSHLSVTHANARPLPKVIDFGIARADQWSGDAPQASGTPTYMSPEQAAGETDADTRSDVFSLGVVLYQLLAGSPPWTPRRLERPAPFPSARLACLPAAALKSLAKLRRLDSRELTVRLRGDLDAIVAKAISLDRHQRYGTVDRLAADIVRHLGNFPVAARPASPRYLARCFLARNRLACLSGAAVFHEKAVKSALRFTSRFRSAGGGEDGSG